MAPPRSLPVSLCLVAATVAVSSCQSAVCSEGDPACASAAEPGTTAGTGTSGSSSGGEPVVTSTGEDPTGSSSTSAEPTSEPRPAVCGDGVVEGDEACDDGNQDNTDGCLNGCVLASCGDGFVQVGVEACEDGNAIDTDGCVNCQLARCGDGFVHFGQEACDDGPANSDAIYDGCTESCTPGPRCGDGKLNGPEDCDDQNTDPSDGCLAGCVEATSCRQVLEHAPTAKTGKYRLWPAALGGNVEVPVWCDMDSDGGGYTFLKVDTQVLGANDKGAVAAEAVCQTFGMHLLVPRTPAHVKSAHGFALGANVTPLGGGKVASGVEYLSILSIYPVKAMATCDGKGLNSTDCPGWRAWDDQRFWVTDKAVPDEPSDEHCDGCSMLYKWNADGSLKSYTTFPAGDGASSYRFICDVADKF